MAKSLVVPKSKLFILIMTDEDMRDLTSICDVKNKNHYDVVEACFHAGLVSLTNHIKCHKHERKPRDKEKIEEKRICPECGHEKSKG